MQGYNWDTEDYSNCHWYKGEKENLLKEHLPGKSPNSEGDKTDWTKVFNQEKGKRNCFPFTYKYIL